MRETVTDIYPFDPKKDYVPNKYKKGIIISNNNGNQLELDDSFRQTRRVKLGESKLLNRIAELEEQCSGNEELFFQKLYELLSDALEEHIDDSEIVKSNIDRLILKIKKEYGMGRVIKTEDKTYVIRPDIKFILAAYLTSGRKFFPSKIENGILKIGVCEDYADYIQKLLQEVGIEAVRIDGISELNHSWVGAIIDGKLKSIDLTRAIFIRDKAKNIPKEQKSSDWLLSDFEDIFMMQKTRTITSIGTEVLKEPMDSSNYDVNLIKELIEKQCSKKDEKAKS